MARLLAHAFTSLFCSLVSLFACGRVRAESPDRRGTATLSSEASVRARTMRVSVIIPCHNAAPYLRQALRSVLTQTRVPDEIIVVDDHSTDGSVEIARSMAPHVRVLEVAFRNACKARNHGLSCSRGDAVMFLDADDLLGPNALAGLQDALGGIGVGVAVGPWFRLEQSEHGWVRRRRSWPPRRFRDPLNAWLTGCYYPPGATLWSRSVLEMLGGWDETCIVNQDGDLMFRALARGVPLVESTFGEFFYRRMPAAHGSISSRRSTAEGLGCRLRILERLARELASHDRLRKHRLALQIAFEEISADAEKHPEIAAACATCARRYGTHPYVRTVRDRCWHLRLGARNLLHRVRLRVAPSARDRSSEVVSNLS